MSRVTAAEKEPGNKELPVLPKGVNLFDYIHGDWTPERLENFLYSWGVPLDPRDPLEAKALLEQAQIFARATNIVLGGLRERDTNTPEIRQALQDLAVRWGGIGHRFFSPSDNGEGIVFRYSGMVSTDSQAQQVLLGMLALLEQGRPDHEILEPFRRAAADYRWSLQSAGKTPRAFLRMLHIQLTNELVGVSSIPQLDLDRCAYQPCQKFFLKLSQHKVFCSKSCKEKASRFGRNDQGGRLKRGRKQQYCRKANVQPKK